jgi:hypothetical protein
MRIWTCGQTQTSTGDAGEMASLRDFAFEDSSTRYTAEVAADLSFRLPDSFEGLQVIPRTCLPRQSCRVPAQPMTGTLANGRESVGGQTRQEKAKHQPIHERNDYCH